MKYFFYYFMTLIFLSNPLMACAACGFSDDSRGAFLRTTILMTFVPLIFMGSVAYFIYRKVKAQRDEEISNGDKDSVSGTDTISTH